MVIFENILNNLQTMGPVFWAGAAAIALGATLLLVSMVALLKRIKFSGLKWQNPFPVGKGSRTSSPGNVAPTETVRKTAVGYEPTVFPLKSQEPSPVSASSMVPTELTDRLHNAANSLEEIIQGLSKENYSSGFSALKEDHEGVEYLFKTTAG